jgi:hypothetical protein
MTIRHLLAASALLATLSFASGAQAANLVQNGSFETNTGNGEISFNTTASPWTATDYAYLFAPGTGDSTGASGDQGNVSIWGPNNGVPNGLPATSPDGGYYVAADASPNSRGAISQTINGLTPSNTYTLNFYDAAAQREGVFGPTTSFWQVSLGSETQNATTFSIPSQGFSGWNSETLTFTASSPSEVLTFTAVGIPAIQPFLLLDGVSLTSNSPTSTPEPGTTAMLLAGLVCSTSFLRSKKRR